MALPAKEISYTFADALAWEGQERIEIVEGYPYMMAPPLRVHQKIVSELHRLISNFLHGKPCEVYPAPFAVRPFEAAGDAPENVDTLLEPDITVVCDPEKLDKYGCRGAPDMVIEILSPSTRRHDLVVKYQIYQRCGVREYWIVDPDTRTVAVYHLEDGHFNAADVFTQGAVVPVGLWDGFSIDLREVFTE